MRSPLVLIVEDEALIAMALADDLKTAGYGVAGPFHRVGDTLDWLTRETPDVAIIDVHLRDGLSADLARVLRDRHVPFIVFSGDNRDGHNHDAFHGARWLSKPVGARQLLGTVAELARAGIPSRTSARTGACAHACAL